MMNQIDYKQHSMLMYTLHSSTPSVPQSRRQRQTLNPTAHSQELGAPAFGLCTPSAPLDPTLLAANERKVSIRERQQAEQRETIVRDRSERILLRAPA